jgi:hypothetical protein
MEMPAVFVGSSEGAGFNPTYIGSDGSHRLAFNLLVALERNHAATSAIATKITKFPKSELELDR